MMQIRDYERRDFETLKDIHALQGVEYEWPNIELPKFFSKLVVEDCNGKPVMATIAKTACELHLLVDHTYSTPAIRWELLLGLHREALIDITRKGVYDSFLFMKKTPKLNRFCRRLDSLGWNRQDNLNALWLKTKEPQ